MKENELKLFNELETYKDPAHESIFLMMNLFKSIEDIDTQKCYDLGFINSQNCKTWDSIILKKNRKEFVNCYAKVIETYGWDAVLVSQQEFINLVEKYQLVCGPFGFYTGDVPVSQLDKISYAESRLKSGKENKIHPYEIAYIYDLAFESIQDFDQNLYYDILKFPFCDRSVHINKTGFECLDNLGFDVDPIEDIYTDLNKNLFIAAPAENMKYFTRLDRELDRLEMEEEKRRLEEERRKQEGEERLRREEEKRRREDPLICTWVPGIGVIIHTAWGTEADDELLQQCHVVNNFIMAMIEKYRNKLT